MKAVTRLLFLSIAIWIISSAQAQVPMLNSYPAARATVFLDFDGQYVTGSAWNWDGPIDAKPSGLSERAISEIFERVAEDCRPFELTLTTDSLVYMAAPIQQRLRLIITPTSNWYGIAGGVSYVGSFSWGDDTPAWVFSDLLFDNAKYIAEACAHELGHTMGLQHQSEYVDCIKVAEYKEGMGEGQTGWAPIMGLSYYKNLTTWHIGPNTFGCEEMQSDLEVIAGNVGLRKDDHGDDPSTATRIIVDTGNFLMSGLINKTAETSRDDVDMFSFSVSSPTNLKLRVTPQNVDTCNEGANVDIQLMLLNTTLDTVGQYNPDRILDAGIDTILKKGLYYLAVKGSGSINHSIYGSLGYYSVKGSLAISLPIHQLVLKGSLNGRMHRLSWSYVSDEPVKNILVEAGEDGQHFYPMATLGDASRNFSYRPFATLNYYRLKIITLADETAYFSNTISLGSGLTEKPAQFLTNVIRDHISIFCNGPHSYELLDASGRLLSKGHLVSGVNKIPVSHISKGVIFLRLTNPVAAWTEALIKQ